MELINWDKSYSVGVNILDKQHKKIINIINELLTHSDANVRSEKISDLLYQLTQYAHEHFLTEEAALKMYKYPKLEEQHLDHKAYRIKIVELCMDTVDHKQEVPMELREFIYHWWKDHILISDMAYKEFFQNLPLNINEEITEDFVEEKIHF